MAAVGGLSCQLGGLTTTTTAAVDKDGIEGWYMLDYAFATWTGHAFMSFVPSLVCF